MALEMGPEAGRTHVSSTERVRITWFHQNVLQESVSKPWPSCLRLAVAFSDARRLSQASCHVGGLLRWGYAGKAYDVLELGCPGLGIRNGLEP